MPENIGPLQKECFDFKHVYAYLENGTLPDETKLAKKICLEASQYALLDGIFYHFYQPRTRGRKKDLFVKQLACPRQFRNDLLKSYHEIGYFGFDRTYLAIKNKYFFPGMYQAVADFIRGCDSCQRAMPHVHAKRVPLTPMPITDTFARWHIDLIGPFKETKLGHRHILIVKKKDGPFYIAAKGLNHTYKLRRCEDNKMLKSMINANRLKLYTPPDHRPDKNAPPPDVPRPDPRREEQPNFQNPVPPPNPNNDEMFQIQMLVFQILMNL
ncbi:unnamed protein product [Mytilus coruscus]|uniref:Integrase zinc-binding domain-containing protein n=1 Tax=Mytilus coruscus TaxID=42192 RepID=A0A6J8BJ70_MYTCO|nr:unnamed protein product [Mytilus coruscus]